MNRLTSLKRPRIRSIQSYASIRRLSISPACRQTSQQQPDFQIKDTETTHFGFKTVPKEEKESLVGQVFKNVAGKYDVMNDLMSAGIHRLWKEELISTLNPTPSTKLLDVAGGTGDIAFRFLQAVSLKQQSLIRSSDFVTDINGNTTEQSETWTPELGSAHVRVVDINPAMLEVGQGRVSSYLAPTLAMDNETLLNHHISFQEQNAEQLSAIPNASVDAYTIAFGIRNCTHIDRVLKEAYRVLKPGGRFLCLEFTPNQHPVVKPFYDIYSFQIIPVLGSLVANDAESYQYLVESIRRFPPQEEFAKMIQDAGFKIPGKGYKDLTFGVAAIHSGFKL